LDLLTLPAAPQIRRICQAGGFRVSCKCLTLLSRRGTRYRQDSYITIYSQNRQLTLIATVAPDVGPGCTDEKEEGFQTPR
jgi:hypothetical protein